MEPQPPQSSSNTSTTDYSISPVVIQPTGPTASPAADLIRQKLSRIYANEPDAAEEEAEVERIAHRSRHQQFMYELSQSGKPLAQIQTEWHAYYTALSEPEKHEVWQEFYDAHAKAKAAQHGNTTEPQQAQAVPAKPATENAPSPDTAKHKKPGHKSMPLPNVTPLKTVDELKQSIITKVQTRNKLSKRQHIQSILFGLSAGGIALVIMLFGFFNERFLAPFMTPSKSVSDSSIIIDPANSSVGPNPRIIIPKINVEIPVVYDVPTIKEAAVQVGLERGVVHYATTPSPGELGNAVIFGHSANNILNKGDYKFAFVLLHKLEIGDTFYIDYNGTRYAYQVFDKKVVPPTDISVLNATEKPASMTLITCDPPGTNLKRLVVVAEQISPDPTKNVASKVDQNSASKPVELPSNSPTLWSRIISWFSD